MLAVVGIITLSLSLSATAQNASLDLIQNLPYLNYNLNFKQYSGYLKANANGTWKFHYWLVESQGNPDTDPLILWLEGGPGCSSVGSFFEELGPFYANRDGQSLYENVFSWNKAANVLFIESPLGTGFSYDSANPNNIYANDDLVASQNYMALSDFFSNVQPAYKDKPFYITGESYAGVYLPTLALNLVTGINSGSFPNKNFKGMAIGNGYMNEKHLTNSVIIWGNYHARISTEIWADIKKACNCTGDVDDCNFYQYLTTNNHLDCDSNNSTCGDLIVPLLTLPDNQDLYNYYQDCYDTNNSDSSQRHMKRRIPKPSWKAFQDTVVSMPIDIEIGRPTWKSSQDTAFGFPCWNDVAAEAYLNKQEVQAALHIAKDWQNSVATWQDCRDDIYDQYIVTYIDTSDLFRYIIGNVTTPDFRILIYSGDTDIVCNFLGVAWHIRDLAKSLGMPSSQHIPWFYRGQVAGHGQRYSGKVPIDLLTVKGSGHIVGTDRPGPALQMITNFIRNSANYSTPTGIDLTPKPPFDAQTTTTSTSPQITTTTTASQTTTTSTSPKTATTTTSPQTTTTSTSPQTTTTTTLPQTTTINTSPQATTITSSPNDAAVVTAHLLIVAISSIYLITTNLLV